MYFIQRLKNIIWPNKCILVVHLFSFPPQEVQSSLKSCDWCRRQSLSWLFSTNGSAMKALEARCCYFLSVVSCCSLFNWCLTFSYPIVVYSFFNRCFLCLAPQWRLWRHVSAFYEQIALIYICCPKDLPLFHLIFTNLGILPITWGFFLRQDHRGTLWWGTPGICLVEMFWPIWKAQVIP